MWLLGIIVPEGAIFMDCHFAEANSNELLGTSLDPVSKTPDYKVCAVMLECVTDNLQQQATQQIYESS